MGLRSPLQYVFRWLPAYAWQSLTQKVPAGPVHLILSLGDHFEPGYVPGKPRACAPLVEQQQRLEDWIEQYPKAVEPWRDHDGRCLQRSFFYPAEQYEPSLLEQLAQHCASGYGEIEIHLHHGIRQPDSADNLRQVLANFRDALATRHNALCYWDGSGSPQYAFIHGSFALANSAGGLACGVDSEVQVLAETGCYVDMTFPTGPFHRSQPGKINSLYECSLPLSDRESHRHGPNLVVGRSPRIFPLMVQGPLLWNFQPSHARRMVAIENGAWTTPNPPSIRRLRLWKKAAIQVAGRPDWIFIKLHCHGMDPKQKPVAYGEPLRAFLRELVEQAKDRQETLHFVTAREMVNIILAACDGKDGNPGDFRDYRLLRTRRVAHNLQDTQQEVVKS